MDSSRELQHATERFADHYSQRIERARLSTGRDVGTVTSVTGGLAKDGRAVVAVTIRGQENTAEGYNRTYAPAVGDRVMCTWIGNQLFVDYPIGGAP
ncbi:MAG: hypothetical protein ACXVGO_15025 [Mycobacterium sp.]